MYYVNSPLLLEDSLSRKLKRRSLVQSAVVSHSLPTPEGLLYNVRNGRSHVVIHSDYVAAHTRKGEIELLAKTAELQLTDALNHLVRISQQTRSAAFQLNGVRAVLSELEQVARSDNDE